MAESMHMSSAVAEVGIDVHRNSVRLALGVLRDAQAALGGGDRLEVAIQGLEGVLDALRRLEGRP